MRLADAHPDDRQLVARYYDPAATEASLELHLSRCPTCAARRDELGEALAADYDQLLRTSDGVFAVPKLVAQRARILERLAHPPTARVLAFAPTSSPAPAVLRAVRHSRRWMAAAAVLFMSVGIGSSWWMEGRRSSAGSTAVVLGGVAAGPATITEGDDAFLSEIEMALARPQTAELRALDALTPRAGDVDGPVSDMAR